MLTVWGRPTSSNTQKVVWALEELSVPYERIDAGGPWGGLDGPDFLALNPNGLVPVLRDGDFVLWESNAILRYVSEVHGAGRLQPSGAMERSVGDQWMDWQQTVYALAYADAYVQLIRRTAEERDVAAMEASRRKTVEVIRMLEDQLARTAFLAGDMFSIADIALGIMAYRFWQIVPERPSLPNLERWYAGLDARPAFQKVVASVKLA